MGEVGISLYTLSFPTEPLLQWESTSEPSGSAPYSNYFKGVSWSPGGELLLTATADNVLHVFPAMLEEAVSCEQLPLHAARQLSISGGELIYDYCWYPGASPTDPMSCCLLSTSRGHPIQLWDALTGALRASYCVYDAADAPESALSIGISPEAGQLVVGLDRRLCLFDPGCPGRDYSTISLQRRGEEGLSGLIGTLCFSPGEPGLVAAGSYAGGAALVDTRCAATLCLLQGTSGTGVSLVRFSADGNYVYTGSRGSQASIQCWDVRNSGSVLYSMPRTCPTYQRLEFCIAPSGRHLVAGDEDGAVRWYDLRDGSEVGAFRAASDTINGVSVHPFLPVLATASGQRWLPDTQGSSDEEEEDGDHDEEAGRMKSNVLGVWLLDSVPFEDGC